jgi:glutathione peroxidase
MTTSLYDIPLIKIDGTTTSLREYSGYVVLIVNVASKCGFTPQYAALEKFYEENRDRKFVILGFPSNDFEEQEPGSNAEISSFCTLTYGVQFPLFAKIKVTGPEKHPLYALLTASCPSTAGRASFEDLLRKYDTEPNTSPEVVWNFEKCLIGRNGEVIGRFAPDILPEAEPLGSAIASAIAIPQGD